MGARLNKFSDEQFIQPRVCGSGMEEKMWKIDFYLLPSRNYRNINNDEALRFGEKVDDIKKTDYFFVPDAFYDEEDEEGVSAAQYLYSDQQNDISSYLQEIISKQKSCRKTYETINEVEEKGYMVIARKDAENVDKELCVFETEESYENGIVKRSDVLEVKRKYLAKSETYEIFKDRVSTCFPKLLFYDRAFSNARALGRLEEISGELIRHLVALNDYGQRIFGECEGNEEKALSALKSRCEIVCSGKGSNETLSFKQKVKFMEKDYNITCNSHTKFYNGNNDQRIYFSWGREEICDHRLIVISIGPHWEKVLKKKKGEENYGRINEGL